MEASGGGGTVSNTEPHTLPAHAVTVAEPAATAYAVPAFVASLETCAAAELELVQVTEASRAVLLSLYVPVAISL